MENYQREFIEFVIEYEVLCFGQFTLKSGRQSPYFFNSGLLNDGVSLARLGRFYAQAIRAAKIQYDLLFGPAYKGIPLVSSVAIALAENYAVNVPYCFNRKETKDHGEGGTIVGAPLRGRVLVIDDVISAGTSINLAADIIQAAKSRLAGVAIAFNRQERGRSTLSAVQEIEQRYQINVISIMTLDTIVEYLEKTPGMHKHLDEIRRYQNEYGAV